MRREAGFINPRVAAGAAQASAEAAAPHVLDDLTDVDTSTTAPTDGQVLKYHAASGLWIPAADAGGATNLDGLSDVDTSTTAPTDGEVLKYHAATGQWLPAADAGATNLDGLSDVDTTTTAPTDGQVLQYHAATGQWLPAAAAGGASGLPVLLGAVTVSGVAAVIFDNTEITSTYSCYFVRFRNVIASVSSANGIVQLSPDNGVTWRVAGYAVQLSQWGITTNFSSYNQGVLTSGLLMDWSNGGDAASSSNGEIWLYGLPAATQKTLGDASSIGKSADANHYARRCGSIYTTAEAINAIRVLMTTGNISGTFELYGVP